MLSAAGLRRLFQVTPGRTAGLLMILLAGSAFGQAGLRESLELLDRDEDGYIDPDEITPLSRPYLERIARARRLSLERPNRIDRLQEAARLYYALQNGVSSESVRPSRERSLKGFGTDRYEPVVPEFGLPEVKYPYSRDDLWEAEESLERWDRDGDGYLDRREAARGRWSKRDPFESDLDKDDRLSRLELAQRYARRRLLENDSDELIQRRRRVGSEIRPSVTESAEDRRRRERSEWWRSGGDRYWLTSAVLSRFDENRNGRLEMAEAARLGIPVGAIDADQDGELSRDELFAHFKVLQDQTGGQVEGLPGWFYERDANRDKQVELTEFASELTDARVAEFVALDTNRDGLLTPQEVLTSKAMIGGTFENADAEILPPEKTIVSEIEIDEDFLIADLNLRLTITHTNASALDAYLTGPDGTRIELFTAVGGRDDHFERTLFDDQASTPIVKGRPPFEGSFQPEGLIKRRPGLGAFNGKTIQGIWQLSIRCSRSDRFGMLHRWSLIARPDEESLIGRPDLEATLDSPLAMVDSPPLSDESTSFSVGTQTDEKRFDRSAERVRSSSDQSTQSFWTAERKAEFAAKLRKPTSEEWERMSDDEKKEVMAKRSRAIAEYKQALAEMSKSEKRELKRRDD